MDTSTRTICFRANTTTGLSGLPCATKYTCNTPLHIHDENCNAHHIILHCANEMLYAIEDLHGEFTYMLHLCCSQLWHDIARACCGDEMTCNMGDRMMSDVFPVPIARYTALPCMCIGQAFTYPCVHSFTHLSMCSFKHSLIHACDYLFMYLFIHLSMCSFIYLGRHFGVAVWDCAEQRRGVLAQACRRRLRACRSVRRYHVDD